jgi:hypothetical protein
MMIGFGRTQAPVQPYIALFRVKISLFDRNDTLLSSFSFVNYGEEE